AGFRRGAGRLFCPALEAGRCGGGKRAASECQLAVLVSSPLGHVTGQVEHTARRAASAASTGEVGPGGAARTRSIHAPIDGAAADEAVWTPGIAARLCAGCCKLPLVAGG